jgi:hypothetical protein
MVRKLDGVITLLIQSDKVKKLCKYPYILNIKTRLRL